ncbi:hypothetical protein QF031_003682 [Pseudarthrobacter defluvii]|nr:hypothetical protein [Pseudarthrobacter defluvii]
MVAAGGFDHHVGLHGGDGFSVGGVDDLVSADCLGDFQRLGVEVDGGDPGGPCPLEDGDGEGPDGAGADDQGNTAREIKKPCHVVTASLTSLFSLTGLIRTDPLDGLRRWAASASASYPQEFRDQSLRGWDVLHCGVTILADAERKVRGGNRQERNPEAQDVRLPSPQLATPVVTKPAEASSRHS